MDSTQLPQQLDSFWKWNTQHKLNLTLQLIYKISNYQLLEIIILLIINIYTTRKFAFSKGQQSLLKTNFALLKLLVRIG